MKKRYQLRKFPAEKIKQIIEDHRTPVVVRYYDVLTWIDQEGYLKKSYCKKKAEKKKKTLIEYYKYHEEIPRMFMLPITDTLNQYHDIMRKEKYKRITKMLNTKKKKLNPIPHPLSGEYNLNRKSLLSFHKKSQNLLKKLKINPN